MVVKIIYEQERKEREKKREEATKST